MVLDTGDAVMRAKTTMGRRAMLEKSAKIVENPKSVLALKGHATSQVMNDVLGDIHLLKKPLCRKLSRKNDLLPFEAGGEAHLENLARLNDTSLFALGSHTKKRPHNLVLGRTFAFRILDMMEFGVTNYKSIADFARSIPSAPGSMPCILFNGDDFEASETTRHLRSLLLDVFRGPSDVESLCLAGVDRALSFTLSAPRTGPPSVSVRHFAFLLKKDPESKLPLVELDEIGPSFNLTLRRTRFAPDAMRKESMRVPRDPRVDRKRKNVSKNDVGDKLGQVHLGKQDLSGLVLARMKGLGRKRSHGEDGALPGSAVEESSKDVQDSADDATEGRALEDNGRGGSQEESDDTLMLEASDAVTDMLGANGKRRKL